jgi:hypothetical protein
MMLFAVFALGGCAMPDFDSFRAPDSATLFRPMSVVGLNERRLPPVTAADMIDAEGRCAGAATTAGSDSGAPPDQGAAPAVATAIAIDMTECDVVKRAGAPERVEIGTNERSERTATLTFIHGARPGIYHFTAGRLTSMERAPEPAPATKPVRRAPAPKPPARSAQTAGR